MESRGSCQNRSGMCTCEFVRIRSRMTGSNLQPSSENKTRIIKMTSLDGEYMLLGRNTLDTSNIFVQYGQGGTRTVNVTGGAGIQEAEFVDGFRFRIQSDVPFKMNAEIVNGVSQGMLPANTVSLSRYKKLGCLVHGLTVTDSFTWAVNTSMPAQPVRNVELRVPCKCFFLYD